MELCFWDSPTQLSRRRCTMQSPWSALRLENCSASTCSRGGGTLKKEKEKADMTMLLRLATGTTTVATTTLVVLLQDQQSKGTSNFEQML